MRVISLSRLREFWEQPGNEDAEEPLKAWYRFVKNRQTSWSNWSDVKANISTASIYEDCVVFNIGGNKYRLIARIRYESHKVYILKVLSHKEYDKNTWKTECGCKKAARAKVESGQKKPGRRSAVRHRKKGRL